MDRDRSENTLDPVERDTPSTGNDDTGTVSDDSAREHRRRQALGTEPERAEPDAPEPEPDEPPIPDRDELPGTPRPSDA